MEADPHKLNQALGLFSGGYAHTSTDNCWNMLAQTLAMNNLSPFEYAYWLVFCSSDTLKEDVPEINPSILCMRNLVCSPLRVQRCRTWRDSQDANLPFLIQSQQLTLKNLTSLGVPIVSTLENDSDPYGPVFRCEMVLTRTNDEDATKRIFDRYGEMARLVLIGRPAYRKYAPRTMEWVNKWLSQQQITL